MHQRAQSQQRRSQCGEPEDVEGQGNRDVQQIEVPVGARRNEERAREKLEDVLPVNLHWPLPRCNQSHTITNPPEAVVDITPWAARACAPAARRWRFGASP